MAQTPSDADSGTSASTLPRGKACLRCRKRKMKCDGAKPCCAQCTKAKKMDSCQYDDGKGKTRTQALREKILRLEEEIQNMRDPDYTSPAIVLRHPHDQYNSGSSSSSPAGSPASASLSMSSPYSSFDSTGSPQTVWEHLRTSSPALNYQGEELPLELAQMLLDIFLPHRHQCGLALHPERLRASLSRPQSERRHPVLTHALFLWACFLSRPGSLSQHEQHYLSRTQDALALALQQPHHVVDIVQASCLLARYFFANGRMLEASYHASNAATLAVHAGLHRVAAVRASAGPWRDLCKGAPVLALDAPADAVELGERIGVFWQAYVLDRCLSVALQRPACISDDDGFDTRIDTPWPEAVEEYEGMSSGSIRGDSTLRMFFAHQGQPTGGPGGFSTSALRVKAAALYERGTRLAASWGHSSSQATDFRAFEATLSRFLSTLLPVHQLDAAMPDERRAYIAVHTIAHAAVIELHQRFAREDAASFEKCLRAARGAVALVKHIADVDYEFLDPMIGTCWASAAGMLALEQVTWAAALESDVQHELDTVVFAMTRLGTRFPLASFQVATVLETMAAS